MSNVVVTGPLALIDARVVRYLGELCRRHGPVSVAPTRATLGPRVDLASLRYALGELASVDRVLDVPAGAPPGTPALPFPAEFAACQGAAGRIPDDDPRPPSATTAEILRDRPQPLVLLSGCFDLIHAGHVSLIAQAAGHGPRPVVAALTTRAIRAQPKNQHRNRPLWCMADRLTFLQGLRARPRVLFFDGPDCLGLIECLRPDVFVKSGRDRGRAIVEEEVRLVERLGGRVAWSEGGSVDTSTTAIEEVLPPARAADSSP